MKRRLAKKHQNKDFHCTSFFFVAFGLVILLNWKVNVHTNCANGIFQKRIHMTSASIFYKDTVMRFI